MNCISLETHSESSSESDESYDEQHSACKLQCRILILTLPPFLAIIVFVANAIDIRFGTKTLITNKCTESFIINRNTLLHVSTLLGHLQGERFVTVTLRLHFIVE
jgi:hypothetical protein